MCVYTPKGEVCTSLIIIITYFAVVATYNPARKEFRATRKFCAECLYKRTREEQVAHIYVVIYCFTLKNQWLCDVEHSVLYKMLSSY